MIRRPPRSTQSRSSAASDVYKRQVRGIAVQRGGPGGRLAANLAGVDRAAVGRGSTLTADPAVVATDRLLVALRPSLRLDATRPTVRAPLAGGTVVRLH